MRDASSYKETQLNVIPASLCPLLGRMDTKYSIGIIAIIKLDLNNQAVVSLGFVGSMDFPCPSSVLSAQEAQKHWVENLRDELF